MNAPYICRSCNTHWVYKKEIGESFPEKPKCINCGSESTHRDWKNSMPVVSVAAGNFMGIDYDPSPFTPVKHIPGGLPDNPDTV